MSADVIARDAVGCAVLAIFFFALYFALHFIEDWRNRHKTIPPPRNDWERYIQAREAYMAARPKTMQEAQRMRVKAGVSDVPIGYPRDGLLNWAPDEEKQG